MEGKDNFLSRTFSLLKTFGKALLNHFGGDFPVFLLFLGISFFFWWSMTMSGVRSVTLQVPVAVRGIPDDVRPSASASYSIRVRLEGKGSSIWKGKLTGKLREINVDWSQFDVLHSHASYLVANLKDSIEHRMPGSVMVSSIEPDSLKMHFVLQDILKLPVAYTGSYENVDQYFVDRVKFVPDSVVVGYPDSDSIPPYVPCELESLRVAGDSVTVRTRLVTPAQMILYGSDAVQMTVYASQYTEKRVDVPVRSVHFPDSLTIKTFPSRTSVSFWVSVSDFDKVGADDFQVVVDYDDLNDVKQESLELRLLRQPAGVVNVRIANRSADFLIETR